jgi:hypothetical protein
MVLIGIRVGFIFPVSTWYGIKLEGDKIVSINLSDNNLENRNRLPLRI